jgi:hypothetical protein
MALPPVLQNQKVQIGIIAVGGVVALAFLLSQILGSGAGGGDTAMYPPGMPGMNGPGGPPGGPYGPPGMSSYGPPGMYPSPGMMDPYATGATATTTTTTEKKKPGPKPPRDGDPFRAQDGLEDRATEAVFRLGTEEIPLIAAVGDTPPLYVTRRWEEAAEAQVPGTAPESPDIPMRMAGVLWGPRVYGLLEVNGEVNSYTPGDTVASLYRVERIERDKMILSKRLNNGKRKRIEVPLSGNPYLQGQQGTYDPTTGAGGYGAPGGYPGSGPGGYPGSGPGYGPPGGGGYGPPLRGGG